MNRRSSLIVLVIIIAAAVLFGLLLVNKGDGPVTGMIVSGASIQSTEDYKTRENSPGAGDYLIETKEYNEFKARYIADIPTGKDLYANIHFVECPKGAEFTVKWSIEGTGGKEETKKLATDQQGIISYMLENNNVKKGNWRIEIFSENKKIFESAFLIK